MSQQIGLPEHISEIHFGFLSGKHYIGEVDARHCTNIQILFDGEEWKIHAEFRIDKDGHTRAYDKTYGKQLSPYGIKEKSAAEQTAQSGKDRII